LKAPKRLQAESDKAFEDAVNRYSAEVANHADEVTATRSALRKLRQKRPSGKAEDGDEQREQELKEQLAEFEMTKPKPPAERWFYVNDPTVAALQVNLAPNPTCVLIERDELVGLLISWEIEGHQIDRAFYLEAWNGLGASKGMRISRGNFYVANLCLSLFGGIQPVKLIHYLRDPEINLQHDGMIQRFQVLAYPDPVKNPKFVDQEENVDAKNRCYAILKKLAAADYHRDFGASYGDEFHKVPYFQFDTEGQDRFRTWYLANQAKAEDKSEDPVMQEHLAKFSQLVTSLATIFHVVELADTDSKSTYIPIRHLEKALQWAEYLESHARRIYALAKNPSLSAAFILADKLTDPRTELGECRTQALRPETLFARLGPVLTSRRSPIARWLVSKTAAGFEAKKRSLLLKVADRRSATKSIRQFSLGEPLKANLGLMSAALLTKLPRILFFFL
jgi:hypothetical protein